MNKTQPDHQTAIVDAVVIGRNEGERLAACLGSLAGKARRVIYVDSGSTDSSLDTARAAGAEVVELDMCRPFTAARARNEGLARIYGGGASFVQLIDGDCTLDPGWIATAAAFLSEHTKTAVVCGRRRERHPEASVYNRLCDREWDTPTGKSKACGGDALMRLTALEQAGGFDENLIAGEEPELCLRLRQAGWSVWRLDVEMTLHDANMLRFGQWWNRCRRGGHAFAEGAAMNGAPPERHWVAETRRALMWGAMLPSATLVLLATSPWMLILLLAWPAQILRLALRDGAKDRGVWESAFFNTLGKTPEALGVLEYHFGRVFGRRAKLIEYK